MGLEVVADEYEAPYMGFAKVVDAGGKVSWRKYPKMRPTKLQIKKIKTMNGREVRQLPTEDKRLWFYVRIEGIKRDSGRALDFFTSGPITILVERCHFLRDSFEQFRTTSDLDLRKEIKIHFMDEVCQDAGGLIREWFSILAEEIFAPTFGLFVRTGTSELAYTISTDSAQAHPDHLEYFYFCGQILAKALFEKIPVKAYLSKFLLKKLTNATIVPEDLKYFDTELWNSMSFLLNNKLPPETPISAFTITKKEAVVELRPEGAKTELREENKAEFVDCFVRYHLVTAIERQFEELFAGFLSLIPGDLLQALDCDELGLFLCGDQAVDVKDWKENTRYKGEFSEAHQVIKWFWEILEKFSNEELEKFLQFCTGSTRAPAEGFRGLMSNNGKICPFCIEPKTYTSGGETEFLVAHTCFNRLELPIYATMQDMETVIRKIISTPLCYQFSFE